MSADQDQMPPGSPAGPKYVGYYVLGDDVTGLDPRAPEFHLHLPHDAPQQDHPPQQDSPQPNPPRQDPPQTTTVCSLCEELNATTEHPKLEKKHQFIFQKTQARLEVTHDALCSATHPLRSGIKWAKKTRNRHGFEGLTGCKEIVADFRWLA